MRIRKHEHSFQKLLRNAGGFDQLAKLEHDTSSVLGVELATFKMCALIAKGLIE